MTVWARRSAGPDYFQVMDRLIAAEPTAGLYHAHFRLIDDGGRSFEDAFHAVP